MQPDVPDKVVRVREGRDRTRLGPVESSVLAAEVAVLGVLRAAEDRKRMASDREHDVSEERPADRGGTNDTHKAGLAIYPSVRLRVSRWAWAVAKDPLVIGF